MARTANVKSIDALRRFAAELKEYQLALLQTLENLSSEAQRGVSWVVEDRSRYWPAQARAASDLLAEARIALERCEMTLFEDERRSCAEEKKAYEKAKRRLAYSEDQVRTVRKWSRIVQDEKEDFSTRLAQLAHFLEYELPRGIAYMEKAATTLEKYTDRATGAESQAD